MGGWTILGAMLGGGAGFGVGIALMQAHDAKMSAAEGPCLDWVNAHGGPSAAPAGQSGAQWGASQGSADCALVAETPGSHDNMYIYGGAAAGIVVGGLVAYFMTKRSG